MLTPPKNPLGVTPEAKKQRGTQLVSKAQRRAAALGLLQGGHPFQEVAAAFGVSEATLKAWRRCYEEEGLDGLVDGPRSGRPRKADQRYIDALEVVLTETPDDMGIDDATGWSVAMLCAVMEQKTGMRLGQRQMRQLLRHLGYRYQPAPSLLDILTPSPPADPSELLAWLMMVKELRDKLPDSKCRPVLTWVKVDGEETPAPK